MALISTGGRFVWWKTNHGAGARILAADPGLVADGALTAAAEEVEVLTVVLGLAHVHDLAANGALTPGQGGSRAPNQRENPWRNPALINQIVPPRAKNLALAQTLASPAPRADPGSKRSVNPGVVPRRNLPVRSQEAAHAPIQRKEMRNVPQSRLLAKIVSSPSLQPSALPPGPGLALDPDQPHKIDDFGKDVLNKMKVTSYTPGLWPLCFRCLQIEKGLYLLAQIGKSGSLYFLVSLFCLLFL